MDVMQELRTSESALNSLESPLYPLYPRNVSQLTTIAKLRGFDYDESWHGDERADQLRAQNTNTLRDSPLLFT